jgi:beta-glucosidase
MRVLGIRTALHPMADLATEPRWARVNGTFGEDAALSSTMTAAYVIGFQGEEIGPKSVACMTKHWPGGGPQQDGEDAHFSYGKNQVYPGNNFDYHLLPFQAAIDAGTAMIMPYYSIPKDQTSENVGMGFNTEIINGLLRNEYGYDGIVCSDWGILEGFSFAGIEIVEAKDWGVEDLSIEDKIIMAIEAGVDQFGGNNNGDQLLTAVNKGAVTEARLDQSVRRLLKVKFEIGLFENPYVDENKADQVVGSRSYMREGAEAQRKAMVLLKNSAHGDGEILPLDENIKLYVEEIDTEIASKYARIVEDPLEADVALIRLQTPWEARTDNFVEQFFHQGTLEFEQEDIERLVDISNNIPTVFFIYLDRGAVVPEINAAATGMVAEFGATDEAVLDIAFGKSKPMGQLPIELPSSMDAVRAQMEDVPYDSKEPLYPFGHGLRY